VRPKTTGRGHPQRAAKLLAPQSGQVLCLVNGLDSDARVFQQCQAIVAQAECMRASVEQPCCQLTFERGHLLGHRGLPDAQITRSSGETAGLGHAQEYAKRSDQIHSQTPKPSIPIPESHGPHDRKHCSQWPNRAPQ